MIDAFAILSTTIAILFVVIRAAMLDRTQPWFEEEPPSPAGRTGPGAPAMCDGGTVAGTDGFRRG